MAMVKVILYVFVAGCSFFAGYLLQESDLTSKTEVKSECAIVDKTGVTTKYSGEACVSQKPVKMVSVSSENDVLVNPTVLTKENPKLYY